MLQLAQDGLLSVLPPSLAQEVYEGNEEVIGDLIEEELELHN
jgi:hypothetical protein